MFNKGQLIEILSYKGLVFDSKFKDRKGFACVTRSMLNSQNRELITVQLFGPPDQPKVYKNFLVDELEYE